MLWTNSQVRRLPIGRRWTFFGPGRRARLATTGMVGSQPTAGIVCGNNRLSSRSVADRISAADGRNAEFASANEIH